MPSRGRPLQLSRMIESALQTSNAPESIEFIVYADSDDSSMKNFSQLNTRIIFGPKMSISRMTNTCYKNATGDILMYAADDIVFRTDSWDTKIIEAVKSANSDYLLVHGDDLGQKSKKIATHGFVSRKFADCLGYLLPPYFYADFCDTWLTSIANHSKSRIELKDLIIEHLHPSWGKANIDETYLARTREKRFWKEYLKYQIYMPLRLSEILKIKLYKLSR